MDTKLLSRQLFKTSLELTSALKNLSASTTTVVLEENTLPRLSDTQLIEIFQGLPASVTMLCLYQNGLGKKSAAELAKAFQGLPASVRVLDLSRNYQLLLQPGAELATAFKEIPASVAVLNLSKNELSRQPGAELATALQGLPASVTTLNLSDNQLFRRSGAELATAFKGIPASVTTLDLNWNNFGNKSGAELAKAFEGIPASVTTLDLSCNLLGYKSGAELATAFKGIPASVTTLDLSHNVLGYKSGAELGQSGVELATALQGLPASVTTLNLRNNNLGEISGAKLATALQGLPASVTTLDLSENLLAKKTAGKSEDKLTKIKNKLTEIFEKFPAHITKLSFRADFALQNLTGKELEFFLSAIPATVTQIDLRNNNFFINKSPEERDKFLEDLGDLRNNLRLNLEENGEDDFTRAVSVSLPAQLRERIPELPIQQIFSYLTPGENPVQSTKRLNMADSKLALIKKQMELIELIKIISHDADFWQPKVRFSRLTHQQFPHGISRFQEIIASHPKKLSTCLNQIQLCASRHYSEKFQSFHHFFRGRDNQTNAIYGILKKINIQDRKSLDNTIASLKEIYPVSHNANIRSNPE